MTEPEEQPSPSGQRGKTVHGEPANAGHRVLAPDDAEVEAYLEVALDAPSPSRAPSDPPPVAATVPEPGIVAVLDFGSQFAQLIARRVRELNVYSELLPHDMPLDELEARGVRAIILSGGPNSVYDDGAPKPDASIWSGRIPVLGICYGAQLIARRVRELNVYSELLPHDMPLDELEARGVRAFILSGGPNSVYGDNAPTADPVLFDVAPNSGRLTLHFTPANQPIQIDECKCNLPSPVRELTVWS